MKNQDEIIRKTLQKGMQRLDDELFAEKIVKQHLSQKVHNAPKPFLNFASLIIGLSFILISIGLMLLVKTNNQIFKSIGFSEQHGNILLMLSFLFSIYKWIEEFTIYHKFSNKHLEFNN
jgi:uncharacterized Tic20 family protein